MKPIKGTLKQLIKESVGGEVYEIDSYDLINFAKAYRSLGNAVQDQLDSILDNSDNDDVNPNAIDMIQERLGGMNEEIDDAVRNYFAYITSDPSDYEDDEEPML